MNVDPIELGQQAVGVTATYTIFSIKGIVNNSPLDWKGLEVV